MENITRYKNRNFGESSVIRPPKSLERSIMPSMRLLLALAAVLALFSGEARAGKHGHLEHAHLRQKTLLNYFRHATDNNRDSELNNHVNDAVACALNAAGKKSDASIDSAIVASAGLRGAGGGSRKAAPAASSIDGQSPYKYQHNWYNIRTGFWRDDSHRDMELDKIHARLGR